MAFDLSKEEICKELDQRVDKNLALSGHCAQTSFASLDEQFDLNGGTTLKALLSGRLLKDGVVQTSGDCPSCKTKIVDLDNFIYLKDIDGISNVVIPVPEILIKVRVQYNKVIKQVYNKEIQKIGKKLKRKRLSSDERSRNENKMIFLLNKFEQIHEGETNGD